MPLEQFGRKIINLGGKNVKTKSNRAFNYYFDCCRWSFGWGPPPGIVSKESEKAKERGNQGGSPSPESGDEEENED